jgi:hypothetical protein
MEGRLKPVMLYRQTQALDTASQTPNKIFLAHKFE